MPVPSPNPEGILLHQGDVTEPSPDPLMIKVSQVYARRQHRVSVKPTLFVSARAARLVRTQGGITTLCGEVKFRDSCMVRVPDELGPPKSYRSAFRIFVHCIWVLN